MELPTGPARARRAARWPWLALAAVFVVPAVGAALGAPIGEWLAYLSGERQIPEFWLRGERSHFSAKPKDPLGPLSPGSLAFIAKEVTPPARPELPPTVAEPAVDPAAPGTAAEAARSSPAAPAARKPLFRPPRLRKVALGGQVVSWFEGSQTTRRAESRTEAFVGAPPPPKAQAKPAPPSAEPAAAKPEPAKPAPAPEPATRERRRVAGRATPGTVVASPGAPGEHGPHSGAIGMAPPAAEPRAPAAPDSAPPPNPPGGSCLVEARPEPGVRSARVIERYPVSGRTLEELSARLAQESRGGRHGPGRTTAEVKPECRFKQEGHLCTPLCSVAVSVRVLVPDWDLSGPPELVDRWKLFAKRVIEHELSHEALFVREGNELLRRLGELRRTPCRDARSGVDLTAIAVRDELRKTHRQYDSQARGVPSCRLEL